jgi:hypothetical protein
LSNCPNEIGPPAATRSSKIYEPVEVSRSNEKLVCEGRASWSDQDETKLKYSTYKDSEGEWMLEYEPIQ